MDRRRTGAWISLSLGTALNSGCSDPLVLERSAAQSARAQAAASPQVKKELGDSLVLGQYLTDLTDTKPPLARLQAFCLKVIKSSRKEGQDVTPAFISRSSIIIFSLVGGVSLATSAETVKMTNKASTDGSFSIAQTQGMNRRGDRRDTRQDCRQEEGAVGADKRNCKQQRRQTRGS